MEEELAAIWTEAKPALIARCEAVQRAAASGDPATFADARSQAHRLVGTIGMFDVERAPALAARLNELVVDGALDDERRTEVAAVAAAVVEAMEQA